tara:strand:+ start:13507 stop:13905 length:399 start_codon:yes stop_codon:yes gene_type:complete
MKKKESSQNDSYLLDSSAWLAYFYGENKMVSDYIESELILLSSTLSLLEVKRKLKKENVGEEKISKVVQFMTQRSILMDVTQEISEMASDLSLENDLQVVDSIMYTTAAINKSILVTGDPQYKNIKNTVVIS